jgi:GNAT superfamily N-acetyltransferase
MPTPEPPEVRVRRAEAGDVEDLLTVSTHLWREDAGTHDPTVMNTSWPAQHGRESFEALVDDPARVGVLAYAGDDLAGGLMGSLPPLTPFTLVQEARLNSLWVDPAHRSSGVGALLLDEFRAWVREKGAPFALVTAYAANPRAQAFYQRQGFEPHTVTMRMPLT